MPSLVETGSTLTVEDEGRRRGEPRRPAALAGLIEGEIIPRLLLAHGDAGQSARRPHDAESAIAPFQADAFADLVLRSETYALLQHVDAFIARGASVESVLLELLAPAARRIGVYWEDDACDFVDVTMGLWRLQEIVHELAARNPPPVSVGDGERRVLFAAVPGEQHSFGLSLIEDFFRRAGWLTCRLGSASQAEIVALVRRQPFDLIGLAANCDLFIDRLPGLIDAIRAASVNPAIAVMAGGRVFAERPELALLVGADATAPDARAAVDRAESLLAMRFHRDSSRC